MSNIYVIAGCNGAGKTTCAFSILPDVLECNEFVNADLIAKGISPFNESSVAFEAGRIMLSRIKELIELKEDFVFETTLSTKSYAKILQQAKQNGYCIHLYYFWLRSTDIAIDRIKRRVSKGGHHIPDDIVKRRYTKSLINLKKDYLNLSDEMVIFDNSNGALVEIGNKVNGQIEILYKNIWNQIF